MPQVHSIQGGGFGVGISEVDSPLELSLDKEDTYQVATK